MTISISGTNGVTFPDSSVQAAAASPYVLKNRIINGDMKIDQRNAGASVTITGTNASDYVLDRWFARASSATGSKISVQRSTVAPAGFINSQLITSLSAYTIGATEHFATMQSIEGFNVADLGWGTANAQTITISFKVRSSLTGTFGGFVTNEAGNRLYVFSYTINSANTFEDKSVTIVGDTSGTWQTDNRTGITISFSVGAGSSVTGSAGSWGSTLLRSVTGQTSLVGTNGATFYITGVQLEIGTTATPFERRMYGQELALCQRYYYRISGSAGRQGTGYAKTTTTADISIPFPVTMRTNPSALEQSGTASDYLVAYQNTASACSAVPTFTNASTALAVVNYTIAAGLTAGNGLNAGANSANSYLAWSAEL